MSNYTKVTARLWWRGADGSRVMVYDVFGRVLATKLDDGGLLRFDAPASGVYLVRVGDAPARKVAVVR